jgi:glucose uptake protein GlcU
MLARWQFNTLVVLGALALLLSVVNATLFSLNRESQAEIAQRQQFIQQSVALESLYREIVKALAELGARGNDRALLDILAAQGLNVSVGGAAAAPMAAAPGSGAARK